MGLPVEPRKRIRQHEQQLGAEQSDTVGAAFGQMRHVDEQAGIHMQGDPHAVLGDRRTIAERLIVPLPAGAEAHLVGIGGDDVRARPQMHLAGHGVDDRRVASVDALDDARRLADRGDAQRLGDDRDVALAAAVLDDQAAQPLAVVVEQFGRPHGARDEDGVGRQARGLVGAGDAAGEMRIRRSERSSRSRWRSRQ